MPRMMLIDASHAEETRVAVLDGNRLDDFDIETDDKKQIKGNIYLAKVLTSILISWVRPPVRRQARAKRPLACPHRVHARENGPFGP